MTDSSDAASTEEWIREHYAVGMKSEGHAGRTGAQADFDRWLADRDRKALAEFAAAIREELHHAALNGHVLDGEAQGAFPGEHVPAVRSSSIEAVVQRFTQGDDDE